MATLVTAILLQENRHSTHSVDKYLQGLEHLASLGLPTIVFLDEKLPTPSHLGSHVTFQSIRLKDLESYQILAKPDVELRVGSGVNYNPGKNTLDFMIIQNAKTELVHRAMQLSQDDRWAWVDAGLFHILKRPTESLKYLLELNQLPGGIVLPGAYETPCDRLDDVHWRFLGGFFTGDRTSLESMHRMHVEALTRLFPVGLWEVNVWAWMEVHLGFKPRWYRALHDDSILNFLPLKPLTTDPLEEKIVNTLSENWMPNDYFRWSDKVAIHYQTKAMLVREFAPKRLIEIGVRCGYSALAFHLAVPELLIFGYDGRLDEDSDACRKHLNHLIQKFQIDMNCTEVNSHDLKAVPQADIAHVDGDHSYEGALADIRLVAHIPIILADDCDNPDVGRAVRTFAAEQGRRVEYIDDGLRRVAVILSA